MLFPGHRSIPSGQKETERNSAFGLQPQQSFFKTQEHSPEHKQLNEGTDSTHLSGFVF